jgi:hypothetical protein
VAAVNEAVSVVRNLAKVVEMPTTTVSSESIADIHFKLDQATKAIHALKFVVQHSGK